MLRRRTSLEHQDRVYNEAFACPALSRRPVTSPTHFLANFITSGPQLAEILELGSRMPSPGQRYVESSSGDLSLTQK